MTWTCDQDILEYLACDIESRTRQALIDSRTGKHHPSAELMWCMHDIQELFEEANEARLGRPSRYSNLSTALDGQ